MVHSRPEDREADPDITFGQWFRCPQCGEDTTGNFSAKLFLAFRNASFDLDCGECGYSLKERDPHSQNWRWSIRWRLYFTPQWHTHPRCSRKAHAAAICPHCTSRSVIVELELMEHEPRPGKKTYETRFAARCATCGEDFETRLAHP
jgi:transcription elongation factor Elf1